jgi:hypothetical protein
VFLLLIINSTAFTQNAFDSSLTRALSVYTNITGVNLHLYNGSEYIDYDHRIKGNPFFLSLSFADGAIVYDGILYENVKMFYDILHDDVVIKNYNDTALLLAKEKISSFDYAGHHFVNLVADSSETGINVIGFYDVLYNGKIKLFAKRKKYIVEKINLQYAESSFIEHDAYYIFKDNVSYPVDDKRSVLNVMKDRKTELMKYLRQNKIKFKKDRETAITKMVAYYDGLNKTK